MMFGILSRKKCSKCGGWKSKSAFSKHSSTKDGLSPTCKECRAAYMREWRVKNPELARANDRRNYAKHAEQRSQYMVVYQQQHPEWTRTRNKRYRDSHVEKEKERSKKKYLSRDKEKHREYGRLWGAKNPEKVQAKNSNRRALKMNNGGTVTTQEWQALKEFYDYTCLCCLRKEPEIKLTLDHVLPLKLGGLNVIGNAQPLCKPCNSSKGVKHIDYRKK